MSDVHEWFVETYDRIVSESGDGGSTVGLTRDSVVTAFIQAVQSGEISPEAASLEDQAKALFDRWVMPIRDSRRNGMRRDLSYLAEALKGETILGRDDPAFSLSYPIGDGRDKTLGLWTREDWQMSTTVRYRGAAEATRSAAEFDQDIAAPIIAAFDVTNKHTTIELLS